MNTEKHYISVAPSNGGQTFSFSAGNPEVRFDLAAKGKLNINDVRLVGKFKIIKTSDGSQLTDFTQDVNIDPYSGVSSCIEQLTFSSRAYSSRNLEAVYHYPRLVSSLNSVMNSKSQMDCVHFHESGAKGIGFNTFAERNDQSRPDEFTASGQVKAMAKSHVRVGGMKFATKLMSGFLMGGSNSNDQVNLETLGGLSVTLRMSSDSNTLFGSDASDYHYELSELFLNASINEVPQKEQMALAQMKEVDMSFLSYTSLYNTINSTNFNVVHRLSLGAVLSCFVNFLPTSYINNFAENGLGQYNPVIEQITFEKDGARFPVDNVIDAELESGIAGSQQLQTYPDCISNYMEAFKNAKDLNKSQLNPVVTDYDTQRTDKVGLFGVGCAYDAVSGSGSDFRTATAGFNIQSKLEDPASPASTTNYAAYSFYLARNQVRIVKQQGIQVVS